MKYAFFTLAAVLLCAGQSVAAVKYWDINGATAGASAGTTATGTWDTGTTANWTADSTGSSATTTWTAGDSAVIAAGTNATGAYTITASGTPSAAGITLEEGTVTLAGSAVAVNTGTVTLNAGTRLITASSGGATGTGITLTAGGKYSITGDAALQTTNPSANGSFVSSVGTIALSNNANLTIDYQVTNTLNIIQTATVISGNGNLIKAGPGVIAIASPSTYSGTTTINGGELRVRTTTNALPTTTAVTVNSGAIFNLNSVSQSIVSLAGSGDVGTGSGTLTLTGSVNTVLDGALKNIANAGAGGVSTGNGRLVQSGTGTITFNGVNDIAGSVTLNSGGITVGSTGSLCGDIADVAVSGGTLTLNQSAEKIENLSGTGGTIKLNNAALSLVSDPAASTSYSGTITGDGGLDRQNSNASMRTLTLSGNNSYNGNTTIEKGIISVQHANALGSTAGYTQVNATGAEVLFTTAAGSVNTSEPFRIAGAGSTDNGAIAVTSSANPTISGPVTLIGDATITVSGAAGVTFSNANAITSTNNENLTLAGGTLSTGTGGLISGAINLGTGSLTKSQGGKWVLTSGNIYSGGTIISASGGTLLANNTSGSATGSGAVTVNGGTLGGTGIVTGAVTVNAGGAIAPGSGGIGQLKVGALSFVGLNSTLTSEIDSTFGVSLAAAADLLNVNGDLTIDPTAKLNLVDIGSPKNVFAGGTKFTLISYSGDWENNTTFANALDGSTISVGLNQYVIDYNDTTGGGSNFGGGAYSNYVTLTAIPEVNASLMGGLVTLVIGLAVGGRKLYHNAA